MFMFRSRRSALTKRLWKARVRRSGCGGSGAGGGGGGASSALVAIDNETECETEAGAYALPPGPPLSVDSSSSSAAASCCFNSRLHTTTTYSHYSNNNNSSSNNNNNNNNIRTNGSYNEYEAVVRTDVLKKLKDNQLEMLLAAVESRGADLSACVLVGRGGAGDDDASAHVRCCQVWRWPELRHASELRRLPACASANDPIYVCCNPYHWSRLCIPESPPPPYCFAMDRLKPEDRAPSEGSQDFRRIYPGSLTTNGEDSEMNSKVWCTLAYWELTTRVGRLFPVEVPAVNVFSAQPHGDGLCLNTLAQHSFSPPPEPVRRTRAKIGLGVTLSQEADGVWVYNRSESPIFVNSPTLDDCESPHAVTVYRVPPGNCLCIYDPAKAALCNFGWNFTKRSCDGPVDRNSVRISFAKGWGPKYSRQEVTSCPCWLEVLLAPCR